MAPTIPDIPGARTTYLAHLSVERGLSAHTVAAYARDLQRYVDWCGQQGLVELAEISPRHLADFITALVTGDEAHPPLSSASVARVVVAVRGFHRFCAEEGWTQFDPASNWKPPTIPRRLPKALTYTEVEGLIAAAADQSNPRGVRDQALIEFLYGTGTRIDEAIRLDLDELDLTEHTVIVRGKGDRQRLLPLGGAAVAALTAYLETGRLELSRGKTPAVFLNLRGDRLSRQSAWAVVANAAQGAQIDRPVSPHTLRHSFATHLVERGADVRVVQELLGHASVTTTQIYTKVTVEALREVYVTTHPRALH